MITFNPGDMLYLMPFLILAASGMMLILAEAFFAGRDRTALMTLAVAGSVAAAIASIVVYRQMEPGGLVVGRS